MLTHIIDHGHKKVKKVYDSETFGELFCRLTDHEFVDTNIHGNIVGPFDFREGCTCPSCCTSVQVATNVQTLTPVWECADMTSSVVEIMNDMLMRKICFSIPVPQIAVPNSTPPTIVEVMIQRPREQGLASLPPSRAFNKMDGDDLMYNDILKWFSENKVSDSHYYYSSYSNIVAL